MSDEPINNLVLISDTHAGCQHALCPPGQITLDAGGPYEPNEEQMKIWDLWRYIWDVWVPAMTHGEPYDLVHNAESIDGVHHNSVSQITHNLAIQSDIAIKTLQPVVDMPMCRNYYHMRGTPAHSGESGMWEEMIAKALGAVPQIMGKHERFSRDELYKNVGKGLVHITHHIGVTGTSAYESTAVHKELIESFVEAARWGERPADILFRAHRHRAIGIVIPCELATNEAWSCVTPGWQNKTPFAFRLPGGRMAPAQFGAAIVRVHADGAIRPAFKTWTAKRPTPE